MRFLFAHTNLNVLDLDRSLTFYREALALTPARIYDAPDGSFRLAYLTDGESDYQLELTYLADRKTPYELGDNETHLCFRVQDYEAARKKHDEMQCVCYDNTAMGLYFIEDPDGYWIEIVRG